MSDQPNTPPPAIQKPPTAPESMQPPPADFRSAQDRMTAEIRNIWKDQKKDLPPPGQSPTSAMKNGQQPAPAAPAAPAATTQPAKPDAAAAPAEATPPAADPKRTSVFDKTPKAPEPAKEQPDPFANIKPPEGMSEASQQGWKALKEEAANKIREAQRKADEAHARLETFQKAAPAESAELQRLKDEVKAAHDRLAVLDVQSHPDFAKQYSEPKLRALSEAKEILDFNGKTADLNVLLQKPMKDFNAAVAEMTSQMNGMDANVVQSALRNAYKIAADEKNALANAGNLRESLQSKVAAEQKKAFETTWGKFDGAEGFLQTLDASPDMSPEEQAEIKSYNEAVAATRQTAEQYAFGRLDPQNAAKIAGKAAILDTLTKVVVPRMEREYQQLVKDRNALAAELKAIREAKNPGNFSTTPGTQAPDPKSAYQEARASLKAAFR
jgi:hypothetical protein